MDRTKKFYQSLGFQLNGNPTTELVSFLFGTDGFVIHFFEKKKFKSGLEGDLADLSEGNEVMFTLQAETKSEYDSWVVEIDKAGGKIFFDSNKNRNPFYDENGYLVCVFADPDGHKYNLLYGDNM